MDPLEPSCQFFAGSPGWSTVKWKSIFLLKHYIIEKGVFLGYQNFHFHKFSKNRQLRSLRASWRRKTRSCRTQDFCVSPPNPSRSELPAGQFGQSGAKWAKMGQNGLYRPGYHFHNFSKNRQLRTARASRGRKKRFYRTQEMFLNCQNPAGNFLRAVQVGAP